MTTANILVIDDDLEMCQLLSTVLSYNDFRVETAYDGFEGVKKARNFEPDLVVLDIMMPGMDGWETYQHMKDVSDTPILFLTARKDITSIARGLELGAVDYICKPFRENDLTSRITSLLDWSPSTRTNPLLNTSKDIRQGIRNFDPPMPSFTKKDSLLPTRVYETIKGMIDLMGGILGSIITLLAAIPIALLIKLTSPGPVFFQQVRIGKDGKPFSLLKFRSMYCATPAYAQKGRVSVEEYITPAGRLLRRTLFDELPQFFNVLKGEMSLVGPRPELPNIVARYESWERERLSVKPGVTGWWQINGLRQPMSAHTHLDIAYIRSRSLRFDSYIVWMTILQALSSIFPRLNKLYDPHCAFPINNPDVAQTDFS
jgi:lipopolysaccharide/colanic/teichoic acid biosynthesis glycosyltransferase/CheY-like chemotaxis protein